MRPSDNSPLKRRLLLFVLIVMLAGLAWTSNLWLLNPPQAAPNTVTDAIFVNAGGSGERLEKALELIDDGVAENLVLTPAFRNGTFSGVSEWRGQPAVVAICENPPSGISVICLNIDERSTRGEARAFGSYASEMGWETVTLVSSSHHLHRATLRLSRCFPGEIFPVAASTRSSSRFYVHEYLGNLEAYLLERTC